MSVRPLSERGDLPHSPESYGQSVLGHPLEIWLPEKDTRILLIAGQHGEEPETTVVLSRALRVLKSQSPDCATILNANPDGITRGTRGNANGVDLNRNFPASNWSKNDTSYRWDLDDPEACVHLNTGEKAASEPETRHMIDIVEKLKPDLIIALHAPLACIDDPRLSQAGRILSNHSGLELIDDIGYPTPGSFGTWAKENDHHLITFEFPRQSIEKLSAKYTPLIENILTGQLL